MGNRSVIIIEARDLAMQKLTALERQMGRMGGVLVGTAQEIQQFNRNAQDTSRTVESATVPTSRWGQALGGVSTALLGMAAAYMSVKGLRMAHDLALMGAQAEMTERSFKRMVASVGLTSDVLNEMKAAAGGTIPELRLMQALNTSLIGVSADFGSEMAKAYPQLIQMARAANIANPALGDVSFMLRSLSIGLKRMSPLIIDNLGIQMKLTEGNERATEMYGKAADALTVEEKQMGLLNLTLERGARLVDQVGVSNENAAIKAQALGAAFADTRVEIGKSLSFLLGYQSVLTKVVRAVGEQAERMNEADKIARQFGQALQEARKAGEITQLEFTGLASASAALQLSMVVGRIGADQYEKALVDLAEGMDSSILKSAQLGIATQEYRRQTDLASAGLNELTVHLGAYNNAAAAAADTSLGFEQTLEQLIGTKQVSANQADLLRAAMERLKAEHKAGTLSTSQFGVEVDNLTKLLPQVEHPALLNAKAILKMGDASSKAAQGVGDLTPGMVALTNAFGANLIVTKEVVEYLSEVEKATASISKSITSRATSIAKSYLDMVPAAELQQKLNNIATWGQENANKLRQIGEIEKEAAIQRTIEEELGIYGVRRTALDQRKQLMEDEARIRKQTHEKMMGGILGLMVPTMPEDVWMQALPREDTWDEWARRAASVAAEGASSEWYSQMLAKFPSFGKILEETGDPKVAAATWIKGFYAGMDPSALDLDDIAQQYIDIIEASERWNKIANVIADKVRAKGYDPSEAAIAALAVGDMTTAADLINEEAMKAEMDAIGTNVGISLGETFGEELTTPNYVSDMLAALNTQFDEQKDEWDGLGLRMGETLSAGMLKAMTSATSMGRLVASLAPEILRYLGETGWGRCEVQRAQAGGRGF